MEEQLDFNHEKRQRKQPSHSISKRRSHYFNKLPTQNASKHPWRFFIYLEGKRRRVLLNLEEKNKAINKLPKYRLIFAAIFVLLLTLEGPAYYFWQKDTGNEVLLTKDIKTLSPGLPTSTTKRHSNNASGSMGVGERKLRSKSSTALQLTKRQLNYLCLSNHPKLSIVPSSRGELAHILLDKVKRTIIAMMHLLRNYRAAYTKELLMDLKEKINLLVIVLRRILASHKYSPLYNHFLAAFNSLKGTRKFFNGKARRL